MTFHKFRFAAVWLLCLPAELAVSADDGRAPDLLVAISTHADLVSGDSVLVRLAADKGLRDGLVLFLNDTDVTTRFRPEADGSTSLALLGDLQPGANLLQARNSAGAVQAELLLTNHPVSGPLISGPHEVPFYCSTHLFPLATGDLLGPATGPNCYVDTRVDYVYRTTEGSIKPLPTLQSRPVDLAWTTLPGGQSRPFIIRIETGVINRAIYEIAVLHDPADPTPDPWTVNPGWNGRLIYRFGGGCRSGWYVQGSGTGGVLDDIQLGRGYALASASLNVFGNNCSDLLAAETMLMVKEHFIENYGLPKFTIGWGGSGGAHQQHVIGDVYPGLLDGLIVGQSFPDVTSTTNFKLMDGRLLETYFNTTVPGMFSNEQQRAVAGFGVHASIANQSEGANRLVPDAEFAAEVPMDARYAPDTNPGGARGSVHDHLVNVYGRDPVTGFARRPLDNVGIQYGLAALNDGTITLAQLLDLNAGIGGFDADGRQQAQRSVADPEATIAAYRSGRITWGGNGLAAVPIIDIRQYLDLRESGDNHMRVHSFQTRERLLQANGHADNHVILIQDTNSGFGFGANYSSTGRNEVLYDIALVQMDRWLAQLGSDDSVDPLSLKLRRAKPAELMDACWTEDGHRIAEMQTYDGAGQCNALYPAFPLPRMVAGGPLADNIVKCQLKAPDPGAYSVTFSAAEWARLGEIFPDGVCDWTQPGLGQQPSQSWYRAGNGNE